MNVLHHHLEAVEATSFRDLDFSAESLSEVFINDSIGCSEESKNVLNEVSLVVIKSLPIFNVSGEIHFFGSPEGSLLIFVHLPNVVVLDWKNDESVGVFFEKGFRKRTLGLSEV